MTALDVEQIAEAQIRHASRESGIEDFVASAGSLAQKQRQGPRRPLPIALAPEDRHTQSRFPRRVQALNLTTMESDIGGAGWLVGQQSLLERVRVALSQPEQYRIVRRHGSRQTEYVLWTSERPLARFLTWTPHCDYIAYSRRMLRHREENKEGEEEEEEHDDSLSSPMLSPQSQPPHEVVQQLQRKIRNQVARYVLDYEGSLSVPITVPVVIEELGIGTLQEYIPGDVLPSDMDSYEELEKRFFGSFPPTLASPQPKHQMEEIFSCESAQFLFVLDALTGITNRDPRTLQHIYKAAGSESYPLANGIGSRHSGSHEFVIGFISSDFGLCFDGISNFHPLFSTATFYSSFPHMHTPFLPRVRRYLQSALPSAIDTLRSHLVNTKDPMMETYMEDLQHAAKCLREGAEKEMTPIEIMRKCLATGVVSSTLSFLGW
eukprot:CAMPEP_0201480336 /NCGR_PEP_ID=MMETSP0151_2-20130828/4828_1 /ASSEMBLY_ACC=CAM_ASM_000257 /TAXON_ID=200890 /ORGANISM="Paramoeba atlantica, Strain 621/1 / CCAP 1560/9" /LENGTH=433 /DNA_ID=CAMNT_0047862151 /DNA_START=653 /DNA_END=1951 /DNA_ORIENTATION=-